MSDEIVDTYVKDGLEAPDLEEKPVEHHGPVPKYDHEAAEYTHDGLETPKV